MMGRRQVEQAARGVTDRREGPPTPSLLSFPRYQTSIALKRRSEKGPLADAIGLSPGSLSPESRHSSALYRCPLPRPIIFRRSNAGGI